MGGSYAIEHLTDTIEREATALLQHIDKLGGTLAAIESGFIQRSIQDAAYEAQQAIDSKEAVVVGVNKYTADDKPHSSVFRVDPSLEREQIDRLRQVRASRSKSAWTAALKAVETAATDGKNLVPSIIEAVERHATLGEISDALRGVFGEHRDIS